MGCGFTYEHYREVLEAAKEVGYSFPTLEEFNEADEKTLLLRHDIDFAPQSAARLAEIESDLGISSTYFIRVHSNGYNPFGYRRY